MTSSLPQTFRKISDKLREFIKRVGETPDTTQEFKHDVINLSLLTKSLVRKTREIVSDRKAYFFALNECYVLSLIIRRELFKKQDYMVLQKITYQVEDIEISTLLIKLSRKTTRKLT